jgi:radical SAM-linked protein
VERAFFEREREKAMKSKPTPVCGRPLVQDGKLVCFQCGMQCDLEAMASERASAAERLATIRTQRASVQEKPTTEPARYRLCLEKIGRASFLGHLDMVRELPRVLQRAGVALAYSQGFHPKPVMSFGPALSLGVPSLQEYVDIKAAAPMDPEQARARVNEMCPDGLRVLSIEAIEPGAPAVGACVKSAQYLIGIDRTHAAAVASCVRDKTWLDKVITREKDGTKREFALRDEVEALGEAEQSDPALLARAGIAGDWELVRVTLRVGQNGTVRVQELVDALSGTPETDHRAVRVGLIFAPR